MPAATLTSKGQITLPLAVRAALGLHAGSKVDFELFCLAVSSVNGCEACVKSHEHVVKEGGLTTEQVVDSVRIAATMLAAANALMIPA